MATTAYLDLDQGSDFVSEFTLENDDESLMNLLTFDIYSQFRKSYGSVIGYNFNAQIVDPNNGKITVSLSGEQSSALRPGRYLYDIEIKNRLTGVKTRVVEGILTINPEVTKIP